VDLIAKTRIRPEGENPDQEFSSRLHVRLSGMDPRDFPSLGGKLIRSASDGAELVLEAGLIPLEEPLTEEEKARHLGSTLSITADDPRVAALVEEIKAGLVRGEKKPASPALAKAFWNWVRRNVRKEFVIGYPTAAEVIETRRGDCNEHTALVAALCRAAGIPCKAVAGVVLLRGSFYYLAWNEIYVEDDAEKVGWLPVDAAFGQWPADATHIRFVEGDPAEQTAIMTLFGNLQIAILPSGGEPS
jgi:transglutaminase-like putative cysteine protease